MDLAPGARVDRYVLVELLGEGGQGAVWKAEDLLHPGVVRALKLVPLSLSRPNDAERIRREARALARLAHPSLVSSHALFEDLRLGVLGIAMDFVDGASLKSHERDPRLTQRHRFAVLSHIAHALAYVHENGVAHRDLKLDNVLVTKAFWGEPLDAKNVKVVDFGIAKLDSGVQPLTQLDTVIGTLSYLAPEELDPAHFGDRYPPAADVFAFGLLGWRLFVGEHPTGLPPSATIVNFAAAYLRALTSEAPWPPGAPPGPLGRLLSDCLALQVRQRIPNGQELARRCDELVGAAPSARPVLAPTQALESRPTEVANPPPRVRETLDLPPLEPVVSATQATVLEGARPAPGPAPAVARAPANPPSTGRIPWLFLTGIVVMLGGAAALTYYALFVNLRGEALPPPLPTSVGLVRPAPRDDAASAAPDAAPAASAALGRPADCAADAPLCACCPSGRDCAGACEDWVQPSEHFRLRPGILEIERAEAGAPGPKTEICTHLSTEKELEHCATLAELGDGGFTANPLDLEGLDLIQTGVEIAVYQRWLSEVPIARGALKRPVSRSELCKGLVLGARELSEPGPVRRLVLYLDPAESDGGSRCAGAASSPP